MFMVCYNSVMNQAGISIQKILLVLFVLFISMGIGWYGEKAVSKFFASNPVSISN